MSRESEQFELAKEGAKQYSAITPERDLRILEQRAKLLAKPLIQQDSVEKNVNLLAFVLMEALYAVKLNMVESISRLGTLFEIPYLPRHIMGIVHRRGQSIAVVSLRHFVYPNAKATPGADFCVIVSAKNKRFALQVSDILGVTQIPEAKLLPTPGNFGSKLAPYISAVTAGGLSVLDLDKLAVTDGFGTSLVGTLTR